MELTLEQCEQAVKVTGHEMFMGFLPAVNLEPNDILKSHCDYEEGDSFKIVFAGKTICHEILVNGPEKQKPSISFSPETAVVVERMINEQLRENFGTDLQTLWNEW